jgi:hypothetical protein
MYALSLLRVLSLASLGWQHTHSRLGIVIAELLLLLLPLLLPRSINRHKDTSAFKGYQ